MTKLAHKLLDVMTSMVTTIVCLALLMVLVVACTLAQVDLGTLGAVNVYMRSWIVWWDVPRTDLMLPVFPGGALVGIVLAANLIAVQIKRLELAWKKLGIWIAHAGLILLFAGEFVSGALQVETRLAIEQGQTVNYVESPREQELVLVDTTNPGYDEVYGVPEGLLARGGTIAVPGTPITLRVASFWPNAELRNRGPADPPSGATMGLGPSVSVRGKPPATKDDEGNVVAAVVEPAVAGRSYGTWLVSNVLGAPQSFIHEGHTWQLGMRSRREYLPFAMTLKKFSHDVYPGTDIPKNFSSLVHLSNPARGEERDVLIYMNQPLRYLGKTYYQASFGKGDTLSILQVVENPGWLLPYISCVLVTLGLLIHFGIVLRRSVRRQMATATQEATS